MVINHLLSGMILQVVWVASGPTIVLEKLNGTYGVEATVLSHHPDTRRWLPRILSVDMEADWNGARSGYNVEMPIAKIKEENLNS